jgi:hypothetical protein
MYEQDREINTVGRKIVQQHLASIALHDVTGPAVRWAELSYKDLKKLLLSPMVR